MTGNENIVKRLRDICGRYKDAELEGTLKEAAERIELLEKNQGGETIDIEIFDEEEIHENCTVQVWRNSVTGNMSIGWWENEI